jgi:putative transposase
VRLDRKATSISLLVVLGVRADGQKVLLAIKSMGGESAEAWRTVLDDLIKRGLRRPALLIVDGAPGLDKAIASVWDGVPVQRCTVHKHRNLFAHAPERLHDEITADYNDMIYATTPEEIEVRRKAFIRKWRLKHRAVADSLEEAGERLFTFTRLPPSQWRSVRTTNAIERLHEEFKRRIKTQTVLPSADTAAMLFWALLASGQINMRKVDGWQTLSTKPIDQPIDLDRAAGFHLSRAIVPPQDIRGGHLRLQVIEGSITEVALKGEDVERFGVRPLLDPVVAEQPSLLATLNTAGHISLSWLHWQSCCRPAGTARSAMH